MSKGINKINSKVVTKEVQRHIFDCIENTYHDMLPNNKPERVIKKQLLQLTCEQITTNQKSLPMQVQSFSDAINYTVNGAFYDFFTSYYKVREYLISLNLIRDISNMTDDDCYILYKYLIANNLIRLFDAYGIQYNYIMYRK